ncbi:phage terminase [Mycobacterium bohemicum DSM 44277]|uniref:Phage terminase n=1 Tax=Mycobacterium bohemicum DSM 44277 TaxID=1236609 RepID=A0A0U0WCA0_MYCBE|nr:terminase large subunit [Mycobacterium bohemicum]MCV6968173.1 hypothetical protein [Mycobacterium bohemicum]CPR11955.1 phage terminase [Mycobacterium bohemicum DSM 44277]
MTEVIGWPAEVPEPLSAPPLTNAASDGPEVISWIEEHCCFGEGDHYGQPARLELFEKLFLYWLFAKRPDGQHRFRRALLEVPKGNGKSALSSWVGLYLLCNRFSPVIPVAAASYEQAGLVFRDMQINVEESPKLRAMLIAYEGEIRVKDGPGRAYKVYATDNTNDGARPTAVLADEIHAWVSPKQERSHLVLTNGLSKRAASLELNVTTPGFNRDTLAGRLHDYGCRVNSGEVKDDGFLFVWWGVEPERYDLADDEQRAQAVRDANPAADLFLNVADVSARYFQIPENDWLRYHGGVWTTSVDSWLPPGAWDACADAGKTIPDGARICLGFDGSFSRDSTALIAVTCETVPHVGVIGCWERPANAWNGWRVPTAEVEQTIRDACARFDVAELAVDMYGWRHVFEVLEDDGLPVVDFPQLRSHMVPATERAYDAIRNQELTHSGDARLTRHVANARAKTTPRGRTVCKDHPDSPDKIDLCVAMVMALDRASSQSQPYDVLSSVW